MTRLEKRLVVCDGAMGTLLYARGIPFSRCFDELNLADPQAVKDVHLVYLKAGAEVIETNTFGANRFRLEKFGFGDKVREINLAGARLARELAGDDLYVAGSVGPLGLRLEPLGPTSLEEAREAFREQIIALVEGGVDVILIETMVDVNEAHQALLAARDAGALPVVVQMTIQEDGSTPTGTLPEDFARQLDDWGSDVIGINCSVGPAPVLEALERVARVTERALAAQPNAGLPSTVQGRSIYLCSPEYMASYARRFINVGVRLIGGCCGTTPEHIKAIKSAVRSLAPPPVRAAVGAPSRRPAPTVEPVPLRERSRLAAKLAGGEFPVLIEIVPPKGSDPAKELEGAHYILGQGADGMTVPDGAGSTARMSAQTLAALLQQRTGAEVLLHVSSRDRNVLRIQSDLLGAHALGLRNILAITGDPPPFGVPTGATAVFDIDSIGLVNVLNNLNRGLDVGGNPLGSQTSFLVGVGLNPCAPNLDEQFRRFEYKVEAGADFALTQPVFDVERLSSFLRRIERAALRRIPVMASILPLTSFRNAEFLNNEVPGVSIPPAIMERMRQTDTGDKARAEGLKIAQEILRDVRGFVQGVQIAAPFGRYAMAVEVAQALRQPALRGSRSGLSSSLGGE
ncbi:MAG TPA: bifunctional homocysteine S-methyltransferase/methylenetetrahydrofolate reductase [Terriglobia bacterium]|nr:bifunctional homocysteine S-methyltransferase/methylenetetrahydrofolate reductase [Terriglobia bacterium]